MNRATLPDFQRPTVPETPAARTKRPSAARRIRVSDRYSITLTGETIAVRLRRRSPVAGSGG